MRDFSSGVEWLSINTATVRKQWTLPQIIEGCARHGIRAISPWRDQVAECGLQVASRLIRETGIKLSGYCRGGMFPAADEAGLAAALDDNFRAVDEACELGSPCLVLVVGGLPGALEGRAAHRDIDLRAHKSSMALPPCSNTRGPATCRSRSSPSIRCTQRIAPA